MVECQCNSAVAHAGGPHSKNTADNRSGFFINDKMVLIFRVTLVTEGGIGSHKFSAFRAGFFDGTYFFAGVTAIKFIEQVQKTHRVHVPVLLCGVYTVIKRNKPTADGRKQIIRILTKLNVVPAKSGKVLDEYDIEASGLCVGDQALDTRALEIRSRVAVVDISVDFVPALLPNVALKEKFLILNADGFSVPLVV